MNKLFKSEDLLKANAVKLLLKMAKVTGLIAFLKMRKMSTVYSISTN